jgi:hypothetical protein
MPQKDSSGSGDGLSEKIRIHLGHTDELVVIDHNADWRHNYAQFA